MAQSRTKSKTNEASTNGELPEPGRTPGQAEGEVNAQADEPILWEPGRTAGQAEGERDDIDEYEFQRQEVAEHMKQQKSAGQILQNGMNKARHGIENGIDQVQRSWNDDGTLAQMRHQFQQAAASQGLETTDVKRWLAMLGGGYLVFQGLRRSLGTLSVAGIGMALFYWGLSGESPLKLLQGSTNTTHSDAESRIRNGSNGHLVNLAASPKQVTKNIIVKAKVADVFKLWSNFENFPQFMQNIKSIRKTGDDFSHWVMEGPFGTKLEWDAKTTRFEENKRIGWSSIQGDLKTSGQVTFNSLPDGETEVTVMMQYVPPAGLAGEVVAALFDDPEARLTEDLRNFKRYVEKSAKSEKA